jgi:fumarylacetoacetase
VSVATDATHDPKLRSWVESANDAGTDFPIQNLPFGVFRRRGATGAGSIGVAIGDCVLDLAAARDAGLITGAATSFTGDATLNRLMGAGTSVARALRASLVDALLEGNTAAAKREAQLIVKQADVEMLLPARIGGYSDFYASIDHAKNVGSMFRPENPLLPNYKFVPIGYHGRSSSIVVSGTSIRRPNGQVKDDGQAVPAMAPSRRLDYELEVGAFVGAGNSMGQPIPIAKAGSHLWGVCLLNDWSARDVQTWEYQPLGPFLSKNFATSISPWVVTADALTPFRAAAASRPAGDPEPLPYLVDATDRDSGAFDLTLEVWLRSKAMRDAGAPAMLVSRGSFAQLYWTFAQLLTHHASSGCNLQPGDLIGSGTVSNATKESRGCLLERAWRGTEPLELPTGERRSFLEDGDEVTMRGWAERDGRRRVGLGSCTGTVLPAI